MTHITAAIKADLETLRSRATGLQETLKRIPSRGKSTKSIEKIAEAIARQLEFEERTMEKIGASLTFIHIEEHKKLLQAISLLEFSWTAKRISDEVYLKALNYKLEFHQHYFDEAQLLSIVGSHDESEQSL